MADLPRLVDHTVTWDVIGPRIHHPAICSAIRPAIECPHYRALDRGLLDTSRAGMQRGSTYLAILDGDGVLHLMSDEVGVMLSARLDVLDEFIAAAHEEMLVGG